MSTSRSRCHRLKHPLTGLVYHLGEEQTMVVAESETETTANDLETGCIYGDDCSMYARNPPFNAETLAAFKEAKDIAEGRIPVKWCTSIEEAYEELDFRTNGA